MLILLTEIHPIGIATMRHRADCITPAFIFRSRISLSSSASIDLSELVYKQITQTDANAFATTTRKQQSRNAFELSQILEIPNENWQKESLARKLYNGVFFSPLVCGEVWENV